MELGNIDDLILVFFSLNCRPVKFHPFSVLTESDEFRRVLFDECFERSAFRKQAGNLAAEFLLGRFVVREVRIQLSA